MEENKQLEFNEEERNWLMILHLSVIVGATLVPLIGYLIPFVIWHQKKEDSFIIDVHGRSIFDLLINLALVHILGTILIVLGIGVVIVGAAYIVSIIAPLIAAIKVHKYIDYRYPLPFYFFSK